VEPSRSSTEREAGEGELPVVGSCSDEVLDYLDDEEGQGGGSLRFRPSCDYNRVEFRAKASALPVALSDLISNWFQDRFRLFIYFLFPLRIF
jgi:hypothetical protein